MNASDFLLLCHTSMMFHTLHTCVSPVRSFFFFLMIRRPPRSTLFPTRRSSDLIGRAHAELQSRLHLICRLLLVLFRSDRKSTRLNSSHGYISYAVFCLKKKKKGITALAADPGPYTRCTRHHHQGAHVSPLRSTT